MELPLQITFHNMTATPALEAKVKELAEGLESVHDRIMSCRVVVDQPHRHHKEGNHYQVRIDIKVPGDELVVKRDPSEHAISKDLELILHEAFDEARRQLDGHSRRLKGLVKVHDERPHARVRKLFDEEGYGFLETPDNREIYFHKNSVLNGGFSKLQIGMEVVFSEELGDKGPQASTVRPVGRHGHHPPGQTAP